MTSGQMIRAKREELGMTLVGLAYLVGISAPSVHAIENDRKATSRLGRFAKALDLDEGELRRASPHLDRELQRWLRSRPERIVALRAEMLREGGRRSRKARR